jgi:hypothetical protein
MSTFNLHHDSSNVDIWQKVLWVRIPLRSGVFDTTLCDTVVQWVAV